MINRIRLRDFKTHRDTTVDLGRLTVLVGPNGAGKSSVLMALDMVSFMSIPGWDWPYWSEVIRRGSEQWMLDFEGPGWGLAAVGGHGPVKVRDGAAPLPLATEVNPILLLRLQPQRLAEPAPPTADPTLAADGAGLGAVLAEMILNGSERFGRIVDDVRKVVPQVRGLRVRTVSVPVTGEKTEGRMELLVDFDAARGVPAHAVSDGTLVAIGLLTVLHADPRPKLLLLDDIDQALHPKAQWELIAALRRVLELDPELQIVATTHSPYLVDQLEADEVRVLALDAEGHTRCRALSEHPRARELLSVLSTGELLGAEGEGWVVEGGDA